MCEGAGRYDVVSRRLEWNAPALVGGEAESGINAGERRPYSAADVVSLRGNLRQSYAPDELAKKLWRTLKMQINSQWRSPVPLLTRKFFSFFATMDGKFDQAQAPLLSRDDDDTKKIPFWHSPLKWVLRVVMWAVFISWVALIFLNPSDFLSTFLRNWTQATQGSVYGITGIIFVTYSAPILLIAFLATAYMVLRGEGDEIHGITTSRYPSFRLWTFPVLVDGLFGVVSAAEMIGISIFVTYVIWAIASYTVKNIEILSLFDVPSTEKR